MPIVFVNKTDVFDLIEVEKLEEPIPELDETGQPTGRVFDLRYRSYNASPEVPPPPAPPPVDEEEPPKRKPLFKKRGRKPAPEPEPEPAPEDPWTNTTMVILKREYRPLNGLQAKELALV